MVDKSIRHSVTSPFQIVYFHIFFVKITVAKFTSAISQNFQSWKANRKKQYTIKYHHGHTFDS